MSQQFAEWVSDRSYMSRNLFMSVIGFDKEMPEQLKAALKAIFETNPRTITGFDAGKDVVYDEGVFKLIDTTQLPCVELVERLGKPIQNALDTWIRNHIQGRSEEDLRENGVSIMVIEPDPTHTKAVCAWKMVGVRPTSTGHGDSRRNLTEPPEVLIYNISLDSEITYGTEEVLEQAQTILNSISAINANPYPQAVNYWPPVHIPWWKRVRFAIKRWVNENL
jgi:hypothetical protein